MKIMSTRRRLAAALIAPALAAGTLAAAPSANADAESHQLAAATWLAAQAGNLEGQPDLFETVYAPPSDNPWHYTDLGLNLDLYAALDELGKTADAERIYDAAVKRADEYIDAFGTRYAGAAGKLASMVQKHDGPDGAGDVNGRDVIADLEALVNDAGRAQDAPVKGDTSNTIGQAWVVRALATADSELDQAVTDYLRKQQCDDGSFRLTMADTQCTTGSGSPEVTSFAVQALDVADEKNVGDYDADVDKAIAWLVSEQAADGSYSDEGSGTPNTNSTGLAAVALAAHDKSIAAANAAGWVAKRQVTTGPEAGAIALNDADLAAVDGEIGQLDRDRYVRASVQAALSLDSVLPDVAAKVTRSAQFVSAGKSVVIKVTGFEVGEKVTFTMPGLPPVQRSVLSTGVAQTAFKTPATFGTRTVTVVGSAPGRRGSVAVTVLPAKKLSLAPLYTSVKAGKSQRITVKGLASGEPYKVYYRGERIKTGVATNGTFTYTFKVGSKKGKQTVRVNGAFTNRTNSKTFTVR